MDILEQYEKDLPQEPDQSPQWEPSNEYGWPTRFVMRYSKGRIQNEKQANYVLLAFAAILIVASLFLFLSGRPAKFSEDWKPYLKSSQ